MGGRPILMNRTAMRFKNPQNVAIPKTAQKPVPANPPISIRKEFPESWIWEKLNE